MGHMLNNTIQDALVRRARMLGYNACWVPGTDHASIATEAKVVAKLRDEGINKFEIGREAFLEHAWAWTHKHGGIILDQLKKLGASCDWDRTAFTMDEVRSASVNRVFVELYRRGLIYRGYRMVNWDPQAKTTVSDEEVIHKEVKGKLYFVQYPFEDGSGFMRVATTRPETLFGDVAICVHPDDERYQASLGKRVRVPGTDRLIPVIADAYVDPAFGTGALKITPAHDINDFEIGLRHQLPVLDVLNEDGTLNSLAGAYEGQDRFTVRKSFPKELESLGFLERIEEYNTTVGTSERTGAVIEPRLSKQWFLKMKEMATPALDAVLNKEVELIPDKFVNTYRHWMENVRDWCISRQLWWGHQIPAWYFGTGDADFVVADTAEEALDLARKASGNNALQSADLQRDPDALDTWFSSWLWPLSVFDGILNPENPEVKYYYPTRDLVTAPEILFFWVARMIMAGYAFAGEKPFSKVYLTGIVRDKQGRKMSKSLGNSPDPLDLIQQYGADAVRVGMLLTSPAGNDLPFDEELCLQGRNFSNKIWNAYRLTEGWEVAAAAPDAAQREAMQWFEHRLNEAIVQLADSYEKYRMSEALMTTYKLIWDDFCSWYLEWIKPAYGSPISAEVLQTTRGFFEQLLLLLHPFMPFITEELWLNMAERSEDATIQFQPWPTGGSFDANLLAGFEHLRTLVTEIRNYRSSKGISPKEPLALVAIGVTNPPFAAGLIKLANLDSIQLASEQPAGHAGLLVGTHAYALPLPTAFDVDEERSKLTKELEYQRQFMASVAQKLNNERFVAGAPEAVVAAERKKMADAQSRIRVLEEQLAQLA
jgi:valyl-tRNA synthetase